MAADVVQRVAKFISDFNATSTQLSSGTGSLAQVGATAERRQQQGRHNPTPRPFGGGCLLSRPVRHPLQIWMPEAGDDGSIVLNTQVR
jgi:hypothetical protein